MVTGTRAEYGLLRSSLEAIRRHPRLQLQLVVTGMHLLRKFGHTVDQIVSDGWRVDARVRMQRGSDDPCDQAAGLGRGVTGIARYLHEARSHIVLVLGDRIEAMAGALAGVTTGRIVGHIHGGDAAPGDFDEPIRHAITKLAHVHFAATPEAQARIIQMGEPRERVFCVGPPGLDRLYHLLRESPVRREASGRALVLQHPCGRSTAHERRLMRTILAAVAEADLSRTIIYPNSDRGHTGIIEAIEAHRRTACNGEVRAVRSLEHDEFLRALIEADVLVGNSSSGIIEAPAAGTPSVNIGRRQHGRQPTGPGVVQADESPASIRSGLRRALRSGPINAAPRRNGGEGGAGERIAELLAAVRVDDAFRRKGLSSGPQRRRT